MHSIIIPYRDRERHLEIMLPRLHEKFSGMDYEILVVEQDDDTRFKLAQLFNVGAQYAQGDVLVFHDVDHYPIDDVSYDIDDQPVYPIQRVLFLAEDGESLRPLYDVPAGYRKFAKSAEGHWGGVFILTKGMFERIGGFNPLYNGWGAEDVDRHHRLLHAGYSPVRRQVGTFYGLYHTDNCPPANDVDFVNNNAMLRGCVNFLHVGYTHQTQDVDEYSADGVRWLKVKNIQTTGV